MKKLLLVTAVAALSVSAAQAAPTLYGKAFLTADYVNGEIDGPGSDFDREEDTVQINSTGSKIGLRGSEAMTANTDVIYQLEYGIKVDGDNRTFQSRDTYLGLANKNYGEFRFGRNYSVTDYINNVSRNEGYWDNIGNSTLNDDDNLANALTLTDGERVNNSVVWIAPKYNDLPLELALQYSADETFDDDSNNGYGASLMFDAGTGFTAGIAYDKDMTINNSRNLIGPTGDELFVGGTPLFDSNNQPIRDINGDIVIVGARNITENSGGDIFRVTGSVDLGKYISYPITLAALYQQADFDYQGAEKEDGLVISADMLLPNFARPMLAYIQYDKTDNIGGNDNFDSNQVVIGGKYEYKSNIIAHGYAGYNSADLDGTDADVFAIGGGLEYLF